jgi:GGDEF domain-containing protein/CHASE3 domain sensor protein
MADGNKSKQTEWKIIDLLTGFVVSHFYRLRIARKLMLGYSVLLVLLVGISVYALFNLNRLNEINSSIANTDLPVINTSEKMIDVILAQEFYAQQYLILKTSDKLKQFKDKNKEFKQLIKEIRALPGHRAYPVNRIVNLQTEYHYILSEALGWIEEPDSPIAKAFDKNIKVQQEKIIAVIKHMKDNAVREQIEKTGLTATIGRIAFKASAILCGLGLLFSLLAAMVITRNISGAIKKLKHATGMISEGKFDYRPDIRNKDELGDLAQAFITMAKRLKQLEEMYLDTSPLIAFCLMDIDNFKAYNDHYGYAKGNDVIQATADIISEAVAKYGTGDDFIGHIGGDDYVLITTPDLYPQICEAVIDTFDKTIPGFYSEEDRQRGHIVGENRQGQGVKFPLATLSIAVVTNVKRKFKNHLQYGEVAAEMKEHAKTISGSTFMVDKRGDDKGRKDRKLISLPDLKRGSKGK